MAEKTQKQPDSHLMLLPTLACSANCIYCFGPHQDSPQMTRATLEATACWQNTRAPQTPLRVIFHGGEPLLPGIDFYRMALPLLRQKLKTPHIAFSVQSNLWELDENLCALFKEHAVSLGTSLDGPQAIHDAQRGKESFQRTMAGIQRAHRYGLQVGCICTFTAQSASHAAEIFNFFAQEGLDYSLHAALPGLKNPGGNWVISPDTYGSLLANLLDLYLEHLPHNRIPSLDAICQSVSAGHGGECTFTNCLGHYLAIGPQGEIYPCQRFGGMQDYVLGNIHQNPSQKTLAQSPAWKLFENHQNRIEEFCDACVFYPHCHGGCAYNAFSAGKTQPGEDPRDPYCPAYQHIFKHVTGRALGELFSEANLADVIEQVDPQKGLLRRGALLALMRGQGW